MRRARGEDGQALIEAALTIPLLLLIAVAIFEFGRAYQTWQILTNAAREGVRMAVLPGSNATDVVDRVRGYMRDGQLPLADADAVTITVNTADAITVSTGTVPASRVTITYPFDYGVLNRVARLVKGSPGAIGEPVNMQATALMRNEW